MQHDVVGGPGSQGSALDDERWERRQLVEAKVEVRVTSPARVLEAGPGKSLVRSARARPRGRTLVVIAEGERVLERLLDPPTAHAGYTSPPPPATGSARGTGGKGKVHESSRSGGGAITHALRTTSS